MLHLRLYRYVAVKLVSGRAASIAVQGMRSGDVVAMTTGFALCVARQTGRIERSVSRFRVVLRKALLLLLVVLEMLLALALVQVLARVQVLAPAPVVLEVARVLAEVLLLLTMAVQSPPSVLLLTATLTRRSSLQLPLVTFATLLFLGTRCRTRSSLHESRPSSRRH
jgi:hypothetical protein